MKEKIIKELRQIDRKGINNLIEFLKESDFFTAPASVNHHLNWKGGLALHSWHVYENYLSFRKKYGLTWGNTITDKEIKKETTIIEGLLHDVCKIGRYKIDDEPASDKQINYIKNLMTQKNYASNEAVKNGNITKTYASNLINHLKTDEELIESDENWTYKDDNLPLGHGEKSISIIQDFIDLKDREKLAIRWHMSSWEDGVLNGGKNRDFNRARELYPDVQLLQLADYEATFKEQYIPEGSDK